MIKKVRVIPNWLNMNEGAQYLGISINTLKRLIKLKPDLPVVVVGPRLIRINKKQLDDWLLSYTRNKMEETILEEGAEHYE
jgi:excisionase family DNA binding protein